MSFILDALKKSEVERQRQAIPGLMDSRPAPPRARFPLWAGALIALLAVNVGVLAVMLTRGGAHGGTAAERAALPSPSPSPSASPSPSPSPAAASGSAPALSGAPVSGPGADPSSAASQAPPAAAAMAGSPAPPPGAAAAASAASDHFSPMNAAPPVYAPEIPATQDLAPPAATHRSARAVSSSGGVSHHAAQQADPVLTESGDASDTEVLPSISQIDLTNQPALAALHLDVHVYATKPSERFVYINMRKYREGDTLAEGPALERIRRDGVVLNYQGLRFLLPRQQ